MNHIESGAVILNTVDSFVGLNVTAHFDNALFFILVNLTALEKELNNTCLMRGQVSISGLYLFDLEFYFLFLYLPPLFHAISSLASLSMSITEMLILVFLPPWKRKNILNQNSHKFGVFL